jgi:hypothetical protein
VGRGARGRAAEGIGSGAGASVRTSAGTASAARGDGSAAAGATRCALGAAARDPCVAVGACEAVGDLGAAAAPFICSVADTMSTRAPWDPVSWTSPAPARAKSCFKSSLRGGCSDVREQAASATKAATVVNRMLGLMA